MFYKPLWTIDEPVNITQILTRFVLILFFSLNLCYGQTANPNYLQNTDEIELPLLGDSSSSIFSLQKEHTLGRAWLRVFRSQVKTIDDPQLQDYVEELTHKLATYSELKDRRLDVVIVNNPTINAFAVPGGVMGIHNGLLLEAETEAQFASVLSHELGHLSQRHFARSVEAQQRNYLPNMAGLLASVILAATVGGDAGLAAITATQAASLQSQLRYSRLHEQEADRTGMQTMLKANMDPNAAAAMFEIMQRAARYSGTRPPEFLLTHPVTESRISDATNRARQYPKKMYTENEHFQLMRARVELSFINNSAEAVNRFRAKVAADSRYHNADEYGLVLALTTNGNLAEAQQRLNKLIAVAPTELSYTLAQADIYIAAENTKKAIELLSNSLSITPNNHPLTMALAQALLKDNQPYKAEEILKEHSKHKPNDPSVWYLLAETHGLAGDIVGVHLARAEYFVLNGALDLATKQLGYALPLVKQNHLSTIRIKERITQITRMKEVMKNL